VEPQHLEGYFEERWTIEEPTNTISKSKMILRRLGEGDEAYYTYVEEADNDANKNSALI
jgi:hypothetical protein